MTAIILLQSIVGTGSLPSGTGVPSILPTVAMVAGIVVLGFVLTMSIRRKIARRNANEPAPYERIERIKADAALREDAAAATARMLETAQRVAGQLDAKAERLEQLIEGADDRLRRLAESGADRSAPIATRQHSVPPVEPASSDVTVFHDGGPAPDPLTAAVYQLADGGRDPVEIARELDEQVGKVELILALRRTG